MDCYIKSPKLFCENAHFKTQYYLGVEIWSLQFSRLHLTSMLLQGAQLNSMKTLLSLDVLYVCH